MKKYVLLFISIMIVWSAAVSADVSEGYYILTPQCASSKAVTVSGASTKSGANVLLQKTTSASSQIFLISKGKDGLYTITNQKSGMVLEAAGKKNKSNVRQHSYEGNARQKWTITASGGYYVFKNAASGKALSVKGNKNKNKTNIFINKYSGKKGQKFKLKKISVTQKSKAKADISSAILETEDEIIKFLSSENDDIELFDEDPDSTNYAVSSRSWKESDYDILTNIIGAVESGGQVYGNRDYAAYAGPATSTANEVTITLGWAQYYGNEGQRLIQNIYNKDKTAFLAIDKRKLIVNALKKNWVETRWNPSAAEKSVLIALITSDIGKKCQDELFKTYMQSYVADCKSLYTSDAWATFMYCEIRHLGGPNAAKRIFDKCKAKRSYTLDTIMAALKEDQSDSRSSAQVGDSIFWSRHVKCVEFIQKYAK